MLNGTRPPYFISLLHIGPGDIKGNLIGEKY